MQIPQDLIETAKLKLKSVQSEADFFQLRSQYLGKKSFVICSFADLKSLDPDSKVAAAKELNILKSKLNHLFEVGLEAMQAQTDVSLLDTTLPADPIGVNPALEALSLTSSMPHISPTPLASPTLSNVFNLLTLA